MKSSLAAMIFFTVFACSGSGEFSVSGHVENGAGKKLYFENITASDVITVDSAVLAAGGAFRFKGKRPVEPDFYRLRMDGQAINITVDSTENITVNADTVDFAQSYTVEGSEESAKIKTLSLMQLEANKEYNRLSKAYRDKTLTVDSFRAKVSRVADNYKSQAKEHIFADLSSSAAYFALFQQINGMLFFNPYDHADSKIFGAVANVRNARYPGSPRTEHLKQLFINSLQAVRRDNQANRAVESTTIDSREYFDISLPSVDDNEIRLSEACSGKVTLLDFTASELQESPARNSRLSALYSKYHSRGFDIYQVSLDTDRHFWKNAAVNLPWISVIDPQSIYSEKLKRYNIINIPAAFIINRDGYPAVRLDDLNNAEKEIEKLL
jgi:hypothetical protein